MDDIITGPTCIPYNQELPLLPTTTTTTTTTTAFPITNLGCNFECNCLCSWTLDPTNDMNWLVTKGPSNIVFTGPSADHTLQSASGHYAYIETLAPVSLNAAARIISPTVNIGSSGVCFQFFYHMYGTNINRLNIYAKQNGALGKPILQKIGEQGNKWILGQIYLEEISSVQYVIEGLSGNGARQLIYFLF